MFVVPVRPVRDPITKNYLPAEGKDVPESSYWVRRLRDGDVCLATKPEPMVVINSLTPDTTKE